MCDSEEDFVRKDGKGKNRGRRAGKKKHPNKNGKRNIMASKEAEEGGISVIEGNLMFGRQLKVKPIHKTQYGALNPQDFKQLNEGTYFIQPRKRGVRPIIISSISLEQLKMLNKLDDTRQAMRDLQLLEHVVSCNGPQESGVMFAEGILMGCSIPLDLSKHFFMFSNYLNINRLY